jgi:hypothetical protein
MLIVSVSICSRHFHTETTETKGRVRWQKLADGHSDRDCAQRRTVSDLRTEATSTGYFIHSRPFRLLGFRGDNQQVHDYVQEKSGANDTDSRGLSRKIRRAIRVL